MAEEGCEFELDADRGRNYFETDDRCGGILDDQTADEVFNRIYNRDTRGDTSDEDDEDYDGGFDRKAAKMEDVTPDGGMNTLKSPGKITKNNTKNNFVQVLPACVGLSAVG